MVLTDTAIRNAKPRDREYKVADSGGLYLLVTPAGGKLWRLKFRVDGREKKLALGGWPEIGLAVARKERDKAREALATGADPALEKQRAKHRAKGDAGNTFAAIATEYITMRKADGARPYSQATAIKAEWFAELLAPTIGHMPVAIIQPGDILAALRRIERRGTLETASRCLQFTGRERWPGLSEQGSATVKWIVCRFRRVAETGRHAGRA